EISLTGAYRVAIVAVLVNANAQLVHISDCIKTGFMFFVSCLYYLKGTKVTAFWRPALQKANFFTRTRLNSPKSALLRREAEEFVFSLI
ncbi:MAG: hypothetical protein FWF06_06065, partial [Symbiobacteriaceae bacterium]|nr:hypothetical protein [Symbiobacteriaceae bacterium]